MKGIPKSERNAMPNIAFLNGGSEATYRRPSGTPSRYRASPAKPEFRHPHHESAASVAE
jgi:hypothetical protein